MTDATTPDYTGRTVEELCAILRGNTQDSPFYEPLLAELARRANALPMAEREAERYQRLAREAMVSGDKSVILLVQDAHEIRIHGSDAKREEAFGEIIARWFKLCDVVGESLRVQDARKQLDVIGAKLTEIEQALAPGPTKVLRGDRQDPPAAGH